MNKLFKKVFYNVTRAYAKKYLTGNLGKVVEDDEKITCYVKRSKFKKKDCHYTITCFGIGINEEKVAKALKFNKPICYVIDGIDLKKNKVYISGYNNCEVIIKNCNFGLDLCVKVNGKCTLDNTNITTFSYLMIGANELVIKNIDSEQINTKRSGIGFCSNNRIDIIDSNIVCDFLFLDTNELNIVNSSIVGKVVECRLSTINTDEKSLLTVTNKVNLQIDKFNSININASINGEEISNAKKPVVLQKITEPLALKRFELVNLLKKVKTQCENINSDKVLKYQEELDLKPVSKVLKK